MQRRDALKVLAVAGAVIGGSIEALAANKEQKNRKKMSIRDINNPTEFELKHTPDIIIGEKKASGYTMVEIMIGQKGVVHPSVDNHWIDFIELYADDKLVGKAELEPTISSGNIVFSVKLDGVKTLRAVEGCNLHGIWEYTLTL